ncbi:MAG: hypothetical protein HOH33_01000 [Verrucomicrobia bacterium]|nr:hypothetical protein [Verrucomicrobiota bacterium]
MKKAILLGLAIALAGLSWAAVPGTSIPSVSKTKGIRSFEVQPREVNVGSKISKSRAFFGSPPPVPHTIQSDRNSDWCMGCHALKNRIRERHKSIAPTPHAEFSQCMQCHVKHDDSVKPWKDNTFVGLDFPGKGSRAHELAPPTVPHKTFMRENCYSCHGPKGEHAIRTPHQYRSQCQQCHVAELTQDYTRPQPE